MGVAKFIGKRNGTGDGRIYKCDPPFPTSDGTTDYVWVSATYVMFSGPETYIFACDKTGYVTDWAELEGSFRGGLDHEAALAGAGYTVE